MNRMHVCIVGTVALLAAAGARAEFTCPSNLDVQQRASAPDGWTASYSEQGPRLIGVAVFDGQPGNRASVKPNFRRQIGRETHLVWNLTYSPRSYYLQCQYDRTTALISAPLPAGTRGCDVVLDREASPSGGAAVKRMVCR